MKNLDILKKQIREAKNGKDFMKTLHDVRIAHNHYCTHEVGNLLNSTKDCISSITCEECFIRWLDYEAEGR